MQQDDFYEELGQLVAACRRDPALLHALVFNPDQALDRVPFLSESSKRSILETGNGDVGALLMGVRSDAMRTTRK